MFRSNGKGRDTGAVYVFPAVRAPNVPAEGGDNPRPILLTVESRMRPHPWCETYGRRPQTR